MRNALIALAAAVALTGAAAGPAKAGLYLLTYKASTGTLTATIGGTVDPGNSDRVLVTSVTDAKFNGVAGPPLTFVDSVTNLANGSGAPPVLTLSGDNLDFLATGPGLSDGFIFDGTGAIFGVPAYLSGPNYGSTLELYDKSNYSLTAAVPEPSVVALAGLGVAGVGAVTRRFRRKAA